MSFVQFSLYADNYKIKSLKRIEKDYANKIHVIVQQKEKISNEHQKEIDSLVQRQGDLERQMDIMQQKFKVIAIIVCCWLKVGNYSSMFVLC